MDRKKSGTLAASGRRALGLFFCAAVAAGASAAPASAEDHTPPKTTLKTGGEVQRGLASSFSWTERTGPSRCTSAEAYGLAFTPRKSLLVDPGRHRATVRFFKPTRPLYVGIQAWRGVDRRRGTYEGQAESPPFRLVRGKRESVWKAIFRFRLARGHYYLNVSGDWADEEGCGGKQDATWGFHLRADR